MCWLVVFNQHIYFELYSHFERSRIMDCKFREKEMAYNAQLVFVYERYK